MDSICILQSNLSTTSTVSKLSWSNRLVGQNKNSEYTRKSGAEQYCGGLVNGFYGQAIEAIDQFIYLGSKLTSDGRFTLDVLSRIGRSSAILYIFFICKV